MAVALVTGAGTGIGRACSLALLAEGWQVLLVGRNEGTLVETAQAAGAHAGAHVHRCDVTDAGQVAGLFASVRERHGRLDLLFNNAGVFTPAAPPDRVTPDDWDRCVATNLTGAFLCLSNAFALMREQRPRGGRIINNGSLSAHTPRPGSIAYTATKHAVTGMTKAAALDGRGLDIAVGQIDIGNAATGMTARMDEARMDLESVVETFMAMVRLPLSANVLFTTVMATEMPYVGRG